jgi:hypothetical protein
MEAACSSVKGSLHVPLEIIRTEISGSLFYVAERPSVLFLSVPLAVVPMA